MWSLFSRDPSKDFAYEVNEILHQDEGSFWILHKGKRKATGEAVSVFRYEVKPNEESYMELAKSAVKRLKTLRHPSILTYIDSLETPNYIIMVTEYVEPLHAYLENLSRLSSQQKEFSISWGILTVSKGLCFLNNDCNLIHGNLSLSSIYVNSAGDWKISNFEYLSNVDDSFPYKTFYKHKIYTPPELTDSNRKLHKNIDSWGLGCLIWEIFNGPLHEQEKLKNLGKISKKVSQLYTTLINSNYRARCSVQDFITKAQQNNGYFKNVFIEAMVFLEEIQIKDSAEKNRFFSNLNNRLDGFPEDICKNKILPLIITTLEYGEASSHVLELLFKIGKMLNESDYQKKMVPCIIKLFSSKDRSIRSKLLKELESYAEFIPANLINEQIFPHFSQGFLDSNPIIREQTVKSIYHLATKLNSQILNDEVMKHFARIQFKDPEGGIRTNTIVCLGKIAGHLQPQTRQNIMLPAFVRSLRDPFPPSRIAGILSLSATQNFFTLQDCTSKIMPVLCTILMDPEKQVRDNAFTALKSFISKMEKYSADPSLIEQMESEINQSGSNVSSKFTSGLSWAVSSIAAKLSRTKVDEGNENETSNKIGNLPSQSSIKPQDAVGTKQTKEASMSRISEKSSALDSDNQSHASDLDLHSNAADGWGEDEWENDMMSNLDDFTPKVNEEKVIDSKNSMDIPKSNAWNDDLIDEWSSDWQADSNKSEANADLSDPFKDIDNRKAAERTTLRKTAANNVNNANTKAKRGPMRLGAQKISKTN